MIRGSLPTRPRWVIRGIARLKDAGYLRKWLVLGALIGTVAGVGAILFITALEAATHLLLEVLGGYTPPAPVGEGNLAGSEGFARPWAIPLVVGLGGLISGIIVFRFAPEAEGHGTDAAITAFHHNPRRIRGRASVVKIVASAITIGSGGSAGREGPTAQISAGFGSMLARVLDLSPADARIAVAAGIGSGIGAIFRAPLGGAVLGAEILYREDVEAEALIPSIIASIVGFSIFGAFEGFTPIFGFLHGYRFEHPVELFYFALLGIVAGLMGRLYSSSFYRMVALTKRVPWSPMIKPAMAGLLVGLIGIAVPGVLGTGYGWVQRGMEEDFGGLALWMIVLLPFAKILATSLSIGSGGSGGIFGPGMVIGAFVGAGTWALLEPVAPGLSASPGPFMVVGMIACFGSISHAVLAVMLMVAEMTGSLALLPPAMIALGVATIIVGDRTIYRGQLKNRVESPTHRLRFGVPLLASIRVADVMSQPRLVLRSNHTVRQALEQIDALGVPGAPMVGDDGIFNGYVDPEELRRRASDEGVEPTHRHWPAVDVGASLDDALDALAMNELHWVSVLDAERRVVGILGMSEVIDGYREALLSGLRRLGGAAKGTVLLEEVVTEGPIARRTIADVQWPTGTVLVGIQRGTQLLFPQGSTSLEPGDRVSILARPENTDELSRFFRGRDGAREQDEDDLPLDLI